MVFSGAGNNCSVIKPLFTLTDCLENTARLPPQLWSISCQWEVFKLLKSSRNNSTKLSCAPLDELDDELEELLDELEELELLDELEDEELDDDELPLPPLPPQPINSETLSATANDGATITFFIGYPDVVVMKES